MVAYWDEIEQTQGVYDFTNISWQLEEAQKRDVNVMLAIGRKVPRYPECFQPEWEKKLTNEEEKNTEDIIKRYDLFGNDSKGLYLIDAELAARVYAPPSLVI